MNLVEIWPEHKAAEGLDDKLAAVLVQFGIDNAEVSVRLCDDAEIKELNKQYRNLDKPTDVLSFPQCEDAFAELDDLSDGGLPNQHLGDIVISLETAERQAQSQGHDLKQEVRILACHGLLHLLGFDHDGPEPEAWDKAEQELMINECDMRGGKARDSAS